MALGGLGKIVQVHRDDSSDLLMGRVELCGVARDVCLAYVPEAQVGEQVVVHVGFALSTIDERASTQVFEEFKKIREPLHQEVSEI